MEIFVYLFVSLAALLAGDFVGRGLFRFGIPDEYVFPVVLVTGIFGFWSGLFFQYTTTLMAFAFFVFTLMHQIVDHWRDEVRRYEVENKRLSYSLDAEKRRVERLQKRSTPEDR